MLARARDTTRSMMSRVRTWSISTIKTSKRYAVGAVKAAAFGTDSVDTQSRSSRIIMYGLGLMLVTAFLAALISVFGTGILLIYAGLGVLYVLFGIAVKVYSFVSSLR